MTWELFSGDGAPREVVFPAAPPWRQFATDAHDRAASYQSSPEVVQMLNAAIHLRRPLLITGNPGSGKTTIAYAVARELRLGTVLRWSITSHSTLNDGLYQYDAIGRLQEANLYQLKNQQAGTLEPPPIGRYLRLGPLGTALTTHAKAQPRVLLVDELDKSDIDLPNDLLHIFEEGRFTIPELERAPDEPLEGMAIRPSDEGEPVLIKKGIVRCDEFPLVIFTSNGERDFPPAFYRRCLRLDLPDPDEARLHQIVAAHLGEAVLDEQVRRLIQNFIELRGSRTLATDQLLNAVLLLSQGRVDDQAWPKLKDALLRSLTNA